MILCYVNFSPLNAQYQNNWIVRNHCSIANGKAYDSSEFAFQFDFNCEPPCIKEVIKGDLTTYGIRQITLSNQDGKLKLFTSESYGFFDGNYDLISNDTPEFFWYNSVLAFPTNDDSIILLIYKKDSVYYSLPFLAQKYGQTDVFYALYNINTGKFLKYNVLVDFSDPRYQHTKWKEGLNGQVASTFILFNQYIDEKNGNYFLFFNIGDTIYTSKYNPKSNNFGLPIYSGMDLNRDPSAQNKGRMSMGKNFIINNKGTHALFLNEGIRVPSLPSLNAYDNNALISYKFNSATGMFSDEKLITLLNYNGVSQDMELSPSDTVLYIASQQLRDSMVKIVFNLDYTSYVRNSIKLPLKLHSRAKDVKLGPNGKIYVLAQETGFDTFALVIENPDEPGKFIKFKKICNLFLNNNTRIYCDILELDMFPITYGSYRKVKFSSESACKGLGMRFKNYSDSFWFKKFRYYFGDGDSVDFKHTNGPVLHAYKKPGKYYVKLRAFNKSGGWVWYSDTVIVRKAPSAYFTNQTLTGCQYIQFNFKDSSSIAQIKQDSVAKHWWNYGDGGKDYWQSTNLIAKKDMNHVYYNSGLYTVTHIVSDGYCVDTFTRQSGVSILPAPKPGINASDTLGCTPLVITLNAQYKDVTDSTRWIISNGQQTTVIGQSAINTIFKTPGHHRVMQTQYGHSGCITSDTLFIEVIQGIDQNLKPELRYVSILQDQTIEVKWNAVPFAKQYELYKDNLLYQTLSDTLFIDKSVVVSNNIYHYQYRALDICSQKTALSSSHQNILLEAQKASNDFAVIRWSPYAGWSKGTKHYTLYAIQNNSITHNAQITDTSQSTVIDKQFLIEDAYQKCYVLAALEQGTNPDSSFSNAVCVPYESVIWIPTAITINGDDINETLRIKAYGIKSFTFSIYNRWGEKVFETNTTEDHWQPSPEEQGVYMYIIQANTNYGSYLSKGSITVLR